MAIYEIWKVDMVKHGHPPYRYGHPRYQYGIRDIDMGGDSIDTVILNINMGYLVTLVVVRGVLLFAERCERGAPEERYHLGSAGDGE